MSLLFMLVRLDAWSGIWKGGLLRLKRGDVRVHYLQSAIVSIAVAIKNYGRGSVKPLNLTELCNRFYVSCILSLGRSATKRTTYDNVFVILLVQYAKRTILEGQDSLFATFVVLRSFDGIVISYELLSFDAVPTNSCNSFGLELSKRMSCKNRSSRNTFSDKYPESRQRNQR